MAVSERNLLFAVRNVAQHGDTDVFPFPIENHWFHDAEASVVAILQAIDGDFDGKIHSYPINSVRNLSAVGYSGFRGATQIDPIWNAYLLALVLEIGRDIETARFGIDRRMIFSYRFLPNRQENLLFNPEIGWNSFQKEALRQALSAKHVISTDISDFYSRVYHHRLENALHQATKNTEVVRRINKLISKIAPGGVSYGLPVGGHAARILAELVLNRSDRLLSTRGVRFCRFVDDYYIFADSREEAHSALVKLSDILLTNEGLTLSRAKTRFMSRAEFERSSPVAEPEVAESQQEDVQRRFLALRLRYDPYSATATEDYEDLREQLERFDIIGMLVSELRKSRIDDRLVRQLIKSLRYLSANVREDAVLTLVENLETLYPVFPTVTILLRSILSELPEGTRNKVTRAYQELVRLGSHIVLVPANMAFALRVAALESSEEVEPTLAELYAKSEDMMIRRDIILCMARRRADYWLSDLLKRYAVLTPWEKRALLIASYVLGDEGSKWRDRTLADFSFVDDAIRNWVSKKNSGRSWEIPL
jgi:hypothetical protein